MFKNLQNLILNKLIVKSFRINEDLISKSERKVDRL